MPVLPDIPVASDATTLAMLRARTRDLIAEEVADLWSDTEVNDALNEGRVIMFTELDALIRTHTASTVSGQAHFTMPTDFARWQSVKVAGTALSPINSIEYAELSAASGVPTQYVHDFVSADGSPTVLLYPTPDSVLAVTTIYYAIPPEMTALVGAQWHKRYHFLPCYHAASVLLHKDNLPEEAAFFEARFQSGIADYRAYIGRQNPYRIITTQAVAKQEMV